MNRSPAIKELRAKSIEQSRRIVALCTLNTALRDENARLRREIERGGMAVNPHGKQKAKGRAPAKSRSETGS